MSAVFHPMCTNYLHDPKSGSYFLMFINLLSAILHSFCIIPSLSIVYRAKNTPFVFSGVPLLVFLILSTDEQFYNFCRDVMSVLLLLQLNFHLVQCAISSETGATPQRSLKPSFGNTSPVAVAFLLMSTLFVAPTLLRFIRVANGYFIYSVVLQYT